MERKTELTVIICVVIVVMLLGNTMARIVCVGLLSASLLGYFLRTKGVVKKDSILLKETLSIQIAKYIFLILTLIALAALYWRESLYF